jgi:hypothetical protein
LSLAIGPANAIEHWPIENTKPHPRSRLRFAELRPIAKK